LLLKTAALLATIKGRRTIHLFGLPRQKQTRSHDEAEKQAMFDTCFTYDDHLRANGHWVGGELLQPAETALTLYWKNGKVELLDKLAKFRVLQTPRNGPVGL
jgi:hypothetical protein